MTDRAVEVHVELDGVPMRAGRLFGHRRRSAESATFAYDESYVRDPRAYALEPALPLTLGSFQTPVGRAMFGAMADCAPDRWGRRLIERAERRRADGAGEAARSFGELDFVLGVRDDVRQGALRFAVDGDWVSGPDDGVPHLVDLPRLLRAAELLERDEGGEVELRLLLRAGRSLGGARPKAHVVDGRGRIAIAKFPSPAADEWDVMAWEYVTLRLAAEAGIRVPRARLEPVDGTHVLLLDRFDRTDTTRIGYVSAMTMLEATDGDDGSYLDIADVIERESARVDDDLHELWRRIAFSILVSNTDDHLRNHGFVRDGAAWRLSPAFDLNPDPSGRGALNTAIDEVETAADIGVLLGVAEAFRLDRPTALRVLAEVERATSTWARVAEAAGITSIERSRLKPAFEHDARRDARRRAGH